MIKKDCPCKRTACERYGNCDECRLHHRSDKRKHLTACERIEQKGTKKRGRKND